MKVELIDYNGCGAVNASDHAANVLIFTKSTRLEMKPGLFREIEEWDWPRKLAELTYMANTIPSSWEFINYTFCITDVTRAFTHQFVRSRNASFAQQTMRVLDVKGWEYAMGPTISATRIRKEKYRNVMEVISDAYNDFIEDGAAIEDARGVLPTNILTNIISKWDLRNLADLVRKRSSPRVQGEYREVLNAMVECVVQVHPWAQLFLSRTFDQAAAELDESVKALDLDATEKTRILKLIDQMRATA